MIDARSHRRGLLLALVVLVLSTAPLAGSDTAEPEPPVGGSPLLLDGPERWTPLLGSGKWLDGPAARLSREAARRRVNPRAPLAPDPTRVAADAYRATLLLWARDEGVRAVAASKDLAWRFSDWRYTSPSCLDRVRRQTLDRLTRQDPNLLLAALDLEMAGWWQAIRQRDFPLVHQLFERLIGEIDDGFPLPRTDPDAQSRWLLLLAVQMERSGYLQMKEASAERLDQALRWFPDHLGLLHQSGVIEERLADYAKAHERYGRLVDLDPRDPVARLHAAVTGSRLGESTAAAELAELAGSAAVPAWAREVASLVLVRSAIDEGQTRKALELARRGLEQPWDGRLHALLAAYLVDLPGTANEPAIEADLYLPPRGDQGSSLARYEAGGWPVIAAELEKLEGEVAERRLRLGSALEAQAQTADAEERAITPCDEKDLRRLLPDFVPQPPAPEYMDFQKLRDLTPGM